PVVTTPPTATPTPTPTPTPMAKPATASPSPTALPATSTPHPTAVPATATPGKLPNTGGTPGATNSNVEVLLILLLGGAVMAIATGVTLSARREED
ncbi:MAG: hypothetical protein ABI559_10735, partial [Chloroflexota bacterium]